MSSQEIAKRTNSTILDDQALCTAKIDNSSGNYGDVSQITRRGFCNGLLLTSAALVVAAKGAPSEAATATSGLAGPPMRIEGAEALMPGSSVLFSYPSRNDPAILVRTQDGRYYAYGQKCSHLGCSVHFDRDQRCLQCPCHHGAYDAKSGSVLHGPPQRALDQIFLQMRGGEVWAVGRTSDYEPLITALRQ
jgi:Rieske Fe-S protein